MIKNKIDFNELQEYIKIHDDEVIPNVPISAFCDIDEYIDKLYKNATFFTIYDDGKLVGLLCGYFNNDETKQGFFSYLYVEPAFRNKNLGIALMNEAYEYARSIGYKEIALRAYETNDKIMAFHRKMGYRVAKHQDDGFAFMVRSVEPVQTVLITGAGGVLGRALTKSLLDLGHKVLAVDIVPVQNDRVKNVSIDGDWQADIIIHCAFSRSQKFEDLASSINFTEKVFKSGVKNRVNGIINISSQSVYGNLREKSSNEESKVAPGDVYGLAKYACERMASLIPLKISNIRLGSLIGPEYPERIVSKMIKSALDTGTINIIGGRQVFSFFDIKDAVSGITAMLSVAPKQWKDVYNLGQDESYTIVELAEVIKEALKDKAAIIQKDEDIQMQIRLDAGRFRKDFNWKPEYSISDSVKKILEYVSNDA